jgi:hypothetical protein
MTLLVSHEADLVEANLAYHLARGVDFAVVTENRASPAVVEVIERFVADGHAHLIHEPSGHHDQSAWVTRMARRAATEFGADWVLNLDPDEFYWPEAGSSLKAILAAIPPHWGQLIVPLCHFVPPREEGGFFAHRTTVREVRSMKPSGKRHFTKVAHRAHPEVTVSQGLHRISDVELEPVPAWRPITGLHFPMRGYRQFEEKVIRTGIAHEAREPATASPRNLERLRLQREGRLPAFYVEQALGPEAVAAGVRDGRLVDDPRLRDFFDAHGGPEGLLPHAAEPTAAQVDALRSALMRAIHEEERSPLTLEITLLEGRLAKAEQRLDKERRRHATTREQLERTLDHRTRRLGGALLRRLPKRVR